MFDDGGDLFTGASLTGPLRGGVSGSTPLVAKLSDINCSAYLGSRYWVYSSGCLGRGFVFAHDLVGGEIRFGSERTGFDDGIGNFGGEEANGAQGVIIARDHVIDFVGIAIGIDHGDDGDAQFAGFFDGDGFLIGIDDEQQIRQTVHVFDAGEILLQMFAFAFEAADFLLGAAFVGVFGRHGVEFFETLDGLLHGGDVGKQSAEPALVHIELVAAAGFFRDGFLRLALGAHEKNRFALRGHFADVAHGVFEELESLLEIDNIDPVTFAEDVFFHLWIPALGLVPEVNAGFEQFFHRNRWQYASCLVACQERLRGPKRYLRSKLTQHGYALQGEKAMQRGVKSKAERALAVRPTRSTKTSVWRTGSVYARPFDRTSFAHVREHRA